MNGNPTLEQATVGANLALRATGQWTVHHAPALEKIVERTEKLKGRPPGVIIDVSQVSRLDTFGAWLIERLRRSLTRGGVEPEIAGLSDDYASLVDEVRQVKTGAVRHRERRGPIGMLDAIGRSVGELGGTLVALLSMLGAILTASFRVLLRPTSFRFTSLIHHIEQVCWRAVPIVVLITFLIGCIIAQQGIFHFRKFGADVFVVDMLGVLVLREIGVLLVAIMVAGRSGSAYTAELGSMRMREEVDALRTMGFDPTEVLILPRIIALVISLPILAFLGGMAALYGGGLVAWAYGGVQPESFLARLKEAISINHFAVGMIKAPFMALVIGIVACVEGAAVKGSAESLGQHTTASVVKSIFFVIVMDGVFAIFFGRDQYLGQAMVEYSDDAIIRVRDLTVRLNNNLILDHLDLDVRRGEILGFVGASGAGKSVLTRTIIGLIPKLSGRVEVFGVDMDAANEDKRRAVERRWGVLFQHGALFSSLNVRQNIQFPVREFMKVSERLLDEIAIAKLAMVGLKPEVAERYPSELSGGMIKRVALARALALDPEIVFLDEPTSGLDPISAGEFDQLVMTLQRTLGLTVFMVTHDLDSLKTACNRIAVLGDRKVLLVGTMDDMLASQHPWLRAYFHGKRARAVVA